MDSARAEHQPFLTSEGNLGFQSHGIPQTLTDRIDSFETQLDVEERKRLEHSLLRKLDRRMSILVLIYILNCKSCALLPITDFTKCTSVIDRNNAS